jgi:hypothetical protein
MDVIAVNCNRCPFFVPYFWSCIDSQMFMGSTILYGLRIKKSKFDSIFYTGTYSAKIVWKKGE